MPAIGTISWCHLYSIPVRVQDVPPFSTCDGHPARVYGLNTVGLRRSDINREAQLALKKAFKIIFHSGLCFKNALEKAGQEIESFQEVEYLLDFIKSSKRGVCRGLGRTDNVG